MLTLAMPLATVNRILFRMRRNAATNELLSLANASEAAVHNPAAPILYREFVEGLVRIASERYRNADPKPSLPDSVLRMWTECVKENAMKDRENAFDAAFYSLEMTAVMDEHHHDLNKAFTTYAAGEGGGSDFTMTVREYIRLLRDCAVIGHDCTVEDVVNLFTQFSDFSTSSSAVPSLDEDSGDNAGVENAASPQVATPSMPFVDIYDCELILPEFHEVSGTDCVNSVVLITLTFHVFALKALARTAEMKLSKDIQG